MGNSIMVISVLGGLSLFSFSVCTFIFKDYRYSLLLNYKEMGGGKVMRFSHLFQVVLNSITYSIGFIYYEHHTYYDAVINRAC